MAKFEDIINKVEQNIEDLYRTVVGSTNIKKEVTAVSYRLRSLMDQLRKVKLTELISTAIRTEAKRHKDKITETSSANTQTSEVKTAKKEEEKMKIRVEKISQEGLSKIKMDTILDLMEDRRHGSCYQAQNNGLKQKLLDKDSYFAILLDNDTNGKEPVIGQINNRSFLESTRL